MAIVNYTNEHAESSIRFIPTETRAAWAESRRADVALQRQIRAALDNTDPCRPWDRMGAHIVADIGKPLKMRRTRAERIESLGHWLAPRLAATIGVMALIGIAKGML